MKDNTTFLLGLKDIIIYKIDETYYDIIITVHTKPKDSHCPACGQVTRFVHDYRWQYI